MKLDNNVFHFGEERNIFRKIKLCFKRIKWAWQRATKGYCDWDSWDLDIYYTTLFVLSLRDFAKKTEGYPYELGDADEWRRIILEMADHFENSMEDESTEPQLGEKRDEEARKAFIKALQDYKEQREDEKTKGFTLLNKWFWHLWW